jgi:catechol 2,3-dioxygenase-like lactoylglutathione lyase family enzyme
MDRLTDKINPRFEVKGLNHVALVVSDMKRTVDFYQNVLGMPLIKTCDLPHGMGQHFFFDIGGSSLAFFWFPDAPVVDRGITVPKTLMGEMGDVATAIGSLNHIAFNVDADRLPEYKARLEAAGVKVAGIVNHDDSPMGFSFGERDATNWVSSIYFHDPDGIQLEFAGWTRAFGDHDVAHEAATAADTERYLAMQAQAPVPA